MLGNKIVAHKEDTYAKITENTKKLEDQMSNITEMISDEISKRKDFEGLMDYFKQSLEKFNTVLSETELQNKAIQKRISELFETKTGIDHFDLLSNKVYRKMDELEQNNVKAKREVSHMESYIRAVAKVSTGNKTLVINPYSMTKYEQALKEEIEFKDYEINWHKTSDDLFAIIKNIDRKFDNKIAQDQKPKQRRHSMISFGNEFTKE